MWKFHVHTTPKANRLGCKPRSGKSQKGTMWKLVPFYPHSRKILHFDWVHFVESIVAANIMFVTQLLLHLLCAAHRVDNTLFANEITNGWAKKMFPLITCKIQFKTAAMIFCHQWFEWFVKWHFSKNQQAKLFCKDSLWVQAGIPMFHTDPSLVSCAWCFLC